MPATEANAFAGLDASTRRWLAYEQTVNERLVHDTLHFSIEDGKSTVRPEYWPETRSVWRQQLVWLPADRARVYGPLAGCLRDAFGIRPRPDAVPLLLHPQAPPAHRALAERYGRRTLRDVRATPTSSYRTVLAWRRGRPPAFLKLSLDATVGRIARALRENQIARAVLMSAVFETIPRAVLDELGLDWFSDPAGVAETATAHGWLLRTSPRRIPRSKRSWLVPMFSLISKRGDRSPLLVELIRRSGRRPERFVIEELIEPYVDALAHLLFVEGIQVEANPQNVLLEIDSSGRLTRRMVLRDLSDFSVSIPLRIAREKALPVLANGLLPAGASFPLLSIATDYMCNWDLPVLRRAYFTVEHYGLLGFVWTLNRSLARFCAGFDAERIDAIYLERWQQACVRHLGLRPGLRPGGDGIATDETLAYFLRHVEWSRFGATRGHRLPEAVEPFRIGGRARKRSGRVYDRLECAWGDVFLIDGLPVFFRPDS